MTTLAWLSLTAVRRPAALRFSDLDLSYHRRLFRGDVGHHHDRLDGDHRPRSDAPPGILLWRAVLQWLGGIGIIVMAIAVMPMLRVGGMQLFRMESSEKFGREGDCHAPPRSPPAHGFDLPR